MFLKLPLVNLVVEYVMCFVHYLKFLSLLRKIKSKVAGVLEGGQLQLEEVASYLTTKNIKPSDLNVEYYVSYSLKYNLSAFSQTYLQRRDKPQSCVLLVKRYSETHTSTVALCGLKEIKEYFLNDAYDKEGEVYFFY